MTERLLGLLLLPLLTRRLTTEEYGVWAQSAVVSSVLMPLVVFCLPAAIVKFFSTGVGDAERRRWMRRTLLLALTLFGVLGLAAWLARDVAATLAYGRADLRGYVGVLAILLATDAIFDLLMAYLRAGFRMRTIAALLVSRGGLRFGFMLLAIGSDGVLKLPFEQAFTALALLQLAVVATAFGLEWRRGSAPGSTEPAATAAAPPAVTWPALLHFSAPLVLTSVLTSVNGFTDRFVLTHELGLHALAVYAAVASLVSVANVAYTVLGFTLFPVLSRLWSAGDRPLAARLAGDVVTVFLFMAVPFALWLACVAGTLLPLLATRAYQVPGSVVLLLGVAAIGFGLYQIVLYLLLLAGKGLRAAWLMLLAALLNAGMNLWLVPRFGLQGAAGAAALSNGLLAVAAQALARRHAQARFPWAGALRIAASALAASVLLAACEWLWPGSWTGLAIGVALALLAYLGADWFGRGSVVKLVIDPTVGGTR